MGLFAKNKYKIIIDLQKVNELNAEGCPACGQKFNLGDTAVIACGTWEGGPRLIHESDAVIDHQSGGYIERKCYESQK